MNFDKKMGPLATETRRGPADKLTREVLAAQAAGMSYGTYKGLQYERAGAAYPPAPPKKETAPEKQKAFTISCVICGTEFKAGKKHAKYCSPQCSRKAYSAKSRKLYHEKKRQEAGSNAE